MIYIHKIITLISILLFMSVGWGCIDGIEVELWDECYNIEETTDLDLYNNGLTGEIPSSIGSLINLERIFLANNQLSGTIPTELGELTNLYYLDFSNNLLSGLIPESICNIDWNFSSINNNQLCPPYPECIENFVGYQETSDCEEQSPCDVEIEVELWGGCYNIETTTFINLSYQEGSGYPPLFGQIPSEIGELVHMTDLYLGGNELTVIPPEIGNLINLQSLFLYGNNFTSIPSDIGDLVNLKTLDIGYNHITELPVEVYSLNNLELLRLENNQLTIEIPPEIENLTNLTNLILSYNKLVGEIPVEVGNLSNLSELNLSSNQLIGEIPPEIGNLMNLYVLDLSYNQFSGEIPQEICNLNYVFLTNNQLCPPYPECIEDYLGSQDTLECIECSENTGDLNDDITTDILDIIIMINCILDESCSECSDISEDGTVDVLDIIQLVNIIIDG